MIKNITVEEIESQFFEYHLKEHDLTHEELHILNQMFEYMDTSYEHNLLKKGEENYPLTLGCPVILTRSNFTEATNIEDFNDLYIALMHIKAKGMIELEKTDNVLKVDLWPYVETVNAIYQEMDNQWKKFIVESREYLKELEHKVPSNEITIGMIRENPKLLVNVIKSLKDIDEAEKDRMLRNLPNEWDKTEWTWDEDEHTN